MTPQQQSLKDLKGYILKDLQGPLSVDILNGVMSSAYATIDQHIDNWKAEKRGPIGCKSGCSHCCSQSVWVSEAEVIYLAEILRLNYPEGELLPIRDYVVEYDRHLHGLSIEERFFRNVGCPFLHQAQCVVYPARPAACRGLFSASASMCDRAKSPAQKTPFIIQPGEIATSIRSAVVAALFDKGLHSHNLDLIAGMAIALTDPTSGPRWLAGENAFADAIAPDDAVDLTLASRAVAGDWEATEELKRQMAPDRASGKLGAIQ